MPVVERIGMAWNVLPWRVLARHGFIRTIFRRRQIGIRIGAEGMALVRQDLAGFALARFLTNHSLESGDAGRAGVWSGTDWHGWQRQGFFSPTQAVA